MAQRQRAKRDSAQRCIIFSPEAWLFYKNWYLNFCLKIKKCFSQIWFHTDFSYCFYTVFCYQTFYKMIGNFVFIECFARKKQSIKRCLWLFRALFVNFTEWRCHFALFLAFLVFSPSCYLLSLCLILRVIPSASPSTILALFFKSYFDF